MELAERPKPMATDRAGFPREVEMIISALEVGGFARQEQRALQRNTYRTRAVLRLFSDMKGERPWTLYTRDVNRRSMGFVTPHRLPLGHGGVVEVIAPGGRLLNVHCTLLRCREAAPGWFEGSVYFNRDQADFQTLE